MTHFRTSFRSAFALMTFAVFGLTGCTRENRSADAKVRVNFDLLWNGEAFTLGQTGSDVQGRPVQLERMDCFVGAFELHDTEQGWMDIDTIARIYFADAESHTMLDLKTDGDLQIDGLRMGLGVPADQNRGVDPATYPSNHPLGVRGSSGMHWGWAAGYIFSIYEGRMQTNPEVPFAYHAGDDTCYRKVELMWEDPWLLPCGAQDVSIDLALDAYLCLHGPEDTIDIEIDPISHTGNNLPLAIRWVDLYANAWSLQPR